MEWELTLSETLNINKIIKKRLKEFINEDANKGITIKVEDVIGIVELDKKRIFEVSIKFNSKKEEWLYSEKEIKELIDNKKIFYLKQNL